MSRTRYGACIITLMLGLQLGCSADIEGNRNHSVTETKTETETVEIDSNKQRASIPFTQHLYSKHSPDFTWEWSNTENLPKEVTDRYKEYENSAPGGYLVKETPTEYFICVSIGETESVTKGFEVKSLTLPAEHAAAEKPILKIEAVPASDQNPSDKEMPGKLFTRSLISVAKEELPEGIHIHSMIMSLEE